MRIVVAPLLMCFASLALPEATAASVVGMESKLAATSPSSAQNARSEIVITGQRAGDAPIAVETEFDEDEIAAQGVDSIGELVARLERFIDPNGVEPVLLINGKPAGFDRSILSYPPEALSRVTVLKPEAAALYGASSGTRVVNLVLKKKFASTDADAGADFATAGGQYGGSLGIMRTVISGDTRWNVQARLDRQSALLASSRPIPASLGSVDGVGYIGASDGGEIDPALSAVAGRIVTSAAIPSLEGGVPSLSDFAAMANERHPIDPNQFESLQPSTRNVSLGFGIARPIGQFNTSLTLNANRNDTEGTNGIPMLSLTLPATSQWSPFGEPVTLNRPFAGLRPLRYGSSAQSLAASVTVNGAIYGVQSNFSVSYSRYDNRDWRDTGVDGARLQQLIDEGDPTLDPFGILDDAFLQTSRNRSRAKNLVASINLQKTLFHLPAGPVAWSLSANGGRAQNTTLQTEQGGVMMASYRISNTRASGQMSLNLPISQHGSKFGAFGDLAINLTAGGQKLTGSTGQTSIGGGMTWAPITPVQFSAAVAQADIAPSFNQLDGPSLSTVDRVFDYARQEIVDVNWTTGGNPELGRGTQRSLSLSMMVRPFGPDALTLNFGYRQLLTSGGPMAFPELTPAVEAAFPERVTRDSAGRLLAVDARPISVERQDDSDLDSGLTLHLGGVRRRGSGGVPNFAADPVQLNLSLNYQLLLRSEILIRRGLPVINRLDFDSGASRATLTMTLGLTKRAFGGNLGSNWSSATHVSGSDGDFQITPPLMFNLSTFMNVSQVFKSLRSSAWTKGLRLSFNVQNLFNGYRRVRLDNGSVPIGYSHDEIDPLGRTATLTIRKPF